ncbi:hypothetical protein TWF481_007673 [Arthrobotrys musiformis]|uniref:Uncharacterized protein n=1 Tax=Arthrobotrys musiformis TaxID=47236 RepID=A0AAV9WDZ4_9PEZI
MSTPTTEEQDTKENISQPTNLTSTDKDPKDDPKLTQTPKAKKEPEKNTDQPKKRGRKRKDPQDPKEPKKPKHPKKLPPSPPPTPPPPPAESAADSARKERLKRLPYYYEEMKEIFDYLCDRSVYWKNDLPRNKKYSNRDTKLLEKEVKKKVLEMLEGYPREEAVMKVFEEAEERLKSLEAEMEADIDTKGEVAVE